jgi:hypothetical protein
MCPIQELQHSLIALLLLAALVEPDELCGEDCIGPLRIQYQDHD